METLNGIEKTLRKVIGDLKAIRNEQAMVLQDLWKPGKPDRPGWYLLDLGIELLDSKLGYQHHVVSVRMSDGEFFNSWDGSIIHPRQIDNHMEIPEPPSK